MPECCDGPAASSRLAAGSQAHGRRWPARHPLRCFPGGASSLRLYPSRAPPPPPVLPLAALQGSGELLQRDEPSQTEDEILAILDAASAPGTAVASGLYVRGNAESAPVARFDPAGAAGAPATQRLHQLARPAPPALLVGCATWRRFGQDVCPAATSARANSWFESDLRHAPPFLPAQEVDGAYGEAGEFNEDAYFAGQEESERYPSEW